ncbi:disease resistance protein Roq1-like [Nicotiana tabacum]|uniref:Disease resistance protein Roq1-like n=1 Tax=Nicotiana tabacum TaxID=4097 RepID=A0AC58TQJ8_TOBAC
MASSNQNLKNGVFLSFRGEDTRKTCLGHLYYALKHRGIHTFKDDIRLERGKSIPPELVKAIEQSRFAIVVFSKNYATSAWCLDELAKIMKCKKELGQTVYDMDPSDHVVEDILGKLCQVISSIDNDLVGMESRVREGGWEALARQQSQVLCLENILANLKMFVFKCKGHMDCNICKVFSSLLKVSLTITSVYEGMEIMRKRLRSMKVLIILDDVNQKGQLEIQHDSRRSRIWLPEDIEDLFTGNFEAEAVEGLWIPRNYIPKQVISYYNISEAFRRMKRLRVLVVRATNFCSIDPITHLPSSLRWLDWDSCPLNS